MGWARCFACTRRSVNKSRRKAMGQSRAQRIKVVTTGAALGADIEGGDLSGELDGGAFPRVYQAWNDHLVLRFRDQQLDDDALVAFSRRFGELDRAPIPAAEERLAPLRPEIAVISNIVVG